MELPALALPLAITAGTGYLLGSVNFAVLVARQHGIDILTAGSGNPGATNVKRVIGKRAGNLVFALDAFKGLLAAAWPLALPLVARHAGSADGPSLWTHGPADMILLQLAGVAGALLGHCFSIFLKFKGGKGVAVTIGALLGAMPLNILAGALVWAVFFYTTRYVSVASIAMALALPAIAYAMPAQGLGPHLYASAAIAIFIVITHRTNIRRLLKGEESRFTKPKA